MKQLPSMMICTVGISLLGNLERLVSNENSESEEESLLKKAHESKNPSEVAAALHEFGSGERICGAEINSISSMKDKKRVDSECSLVFLHSNTKDGLYVAGILDEYYALTEHRGVKVVPIDGLQDNEPQVFRTLGLRNLTHQICQVIREYGRDACVINATGGYKAQIAIAVLIGQAVGVSVYYKHERFDEIISFPPMPIALDFEFWMQANDLLFTLAEMHEPVLFDEYSARWGDKFENLVERVEIEGKIYLELSHTGHIFHESFRDRFEVDKKKLLPPAAASKKRPRLEDSGWVGENPEIERFMQKITDTFNYVTHCGTNYFNPDLPKRNGFRLGADGVECTFSNGTYCVKFIVNTTAKNDSQKNAVVSDLNSWLSKQKL